MAFDLSSGDLGGGVGSIASGLFSLFGGTKRSPTTDLPYLQNMVNAISAANTYGTAAMDPSSPYFQNVAAAQEEANRANLIQSIQSIMQQNAKARAIGAPGFSVNPERSDEARQYAVTRGYYNAQQLARQQARDILLSQSANMRQQANAYGPLNNIYGNYANYNSSQTAGGAQQIASGLGPVLQNIFGGSTDSTPKQYNFNDPFSNSSFGTSAGASSIMPDTTFSGF